MAYSYTNKAEENNLNDCFNEVINALDIKTLNIDIKDRLKSPIISGKVKIQQKISLIKKLSNDCQLQSFEDMIEVEDGINDRISHINFTLDGVNFIASIRGLVNSPIEQKEVLSSFIAAVNQHYGSWTIHHEILVSKEVKKSEYAIDISLVFSAISMIKLTDITFIENKLIVKGLVRNISQEEQTLSQLNQIFQADLEIINQIQQVIIDEPEYEGLDIDIQPMELPDLKPKKDTGN